MTEIAFSFWNLVPVTLVQGLLYGFIALAVMIPFRLLSFPDLSSEGSFPLGGCLCAVALLAGWHPLAATVLAVAGGMAAGAATALIHVRLRINTLLAGILVMTILYSVNLRVLGKANAALLSNETVLSVISPALVTRVGYQALVFALVVLFLRTESGLSLRAVGANPALVPSLRINPGLWIVAGLALANGWSGLAGALVVQLQGFADVQMGFGVLITGLASLIIGETLIGRGSVPRQIAAPVLGSLVYYQLVSLGLAIGLKPADLKLATGLFVLVTLALPALRAGGASSTEALRD
jgi:putative tryptophan/tyrosine transport system permease protein